MTSHLMTPPSIPRKRLRSYPHLMIDPLLATPELVTSPSEMSFDSAAPCTPDAQRIFSSSVLPPPTPRFTRMALTPITKQAVPPSPSPAVRVSRIPCQVVNSNPVTPHVTPGAGRAPPATPSHNHRKRIPRTPHTPSPTTGSFRFSSPNTKELPFRSTTAARSSIHRALQMMLVDEDPFIERVTVMSLGSDDEKDADWDIALWRENKENEDPRGGLCLESKGNPCKASPSPFATPARGPRALESCTPPRQVRRALPRSPRHWNLASVSHVTA